ncbi:hypothetical protein HF521_021805 [Silurus meridionalis]|uniref:Hexosyltransferase n=1 Tax=Silurus meridionalis TaxID=175797 RepID=A0A8T0BF69_SILME|nr:hypothetical protein HF521_021805 [Silurus meridionalis]
MLLRASLRRNHVYARFLTELLFVLYRLLPRSSFHLSKYHDGVKIEVVNAGTMHGPRRKLKLIVMTIMTAFIFIIVEISRSTNQHKNDQKVRIPTKPFWAKLAPNNAFWNRQQQKLDHLNNPILKDPNATLGVLPDWLNDTVTEDLCKPDLQVMTQVKNFSLLPDRFKHFLLYMRCRTYRMVVDQPQLCKEEPFLLLAIKSLASHFDRRQAIRESWGRGGRLANKTILTIFLLGNTTAEDHFRTYRQC